MKYNKKTGKFETVTVVEVDPKAAFVNLVRKYYKSFSGDEKYVGYPSKSRCNSLNWVILPIGFIPANPEWSLAVAKALVEFCETYKGTFICGPQYLPDGTDLGTTNFGIVLNHTSGV